MKENNRGFTLIEIMVVVIIIGILAAVATVKISGQANIARIAATRASIAQIKTAINMYEVNLGSWPNNLQDLVIGGDKDYPGPFLEEEEVPKDGWGNDFKYEIRDEGKRVRVTSPGKDGRFDTDDDLWK